jgi:phosphohistidine phosphatase
MEIFILRHGIAIAHGAPGYEKNDDARPLTPKGKKQLRKNSAALKKMKLDFDLILSSPLPRAKETAKIIAEKLKLKKRLRFSHALKPGGGEKKLVQELIDLKPAAQKILLVGHEPDLSGLLSRLLTGNAQMKTDFAKGGLAKLEIEKLRDGKCATLAWLLTPAQMKLMR